jgi:NADPH:quinone reductase-like Zn-dependent oxidoreductase
MRMLAIRQERFGGPEVLHIADVDRPQPQPTEILVRVRAAGVNPVDWATRQGHGMFSAPPFTLGWDVSGVVESVAEGVTRFDPGDAVIGMPRFPAEAGAYSQFVTGPARQFTRKPPTMSHTQAAGLPLAGLTAWQILVDTANVQGGDRVLITAGAGGVGHLAIQIAKALGAYVVATSRPEKHVFLKELGADEAIDYTAGDVAETVQDIDIVVDAIGGANSLQLLPVLRTGGLIVPVTGGADAHMTAQARARGVTARSVLVEPDGSGLQALTELVDAGQLRVEVDTVLPLEEAAEAHRIGERGRTRGKIVLTV